MKKVFALISPAVFALGCVYNTPQPQEPDYSGQSYSEALQMICNVDRLAAITDDDDPLALGRRRTEWIQQNVLNAQSIYHYRIKTSF